MQGPMFDFTLQTTLNSAPFIWTVLAGRGEQTKLAVIFLTTTTTRCTK